MRCTVSAKALAAVLKFAAGAVPARTTIPIVSNIKIEASGRSLTIAATDLDQQHIAAVDVPNLSEPGAATVPGQRFADLIDRFPPAAEVTIKVEDCGQHCLISAGRGQWKLRILPAEEFPMLTQPDANAAAFTLPQAEAHRLVRRVEYAICDEETLYYLNGAHFHRQAGRLVVASTNGHVLAKILINLDPGQDLGVIVPARPSLP
jgi:DNA polymerase-3 subunit beta